MDAKGYFPANAAFVEVGHEQLILSNSSDACIEFSDDCVAIDGLPAGRYKGSSESDREMEQIYNSNDFRYALRAPLQPTYRPAPTGWDLWKSAQQSLFMSRPTYRFKAFLSKLAREFMRRHRNPRFGAGSGQPCATIHVRRGDKLMELKAATAADTPKDWNLHDRASFNHSGSEYVAKAKELAKTAAVDIRTIFVMTGKPAISRTSALSFFCCRFFCDGVFHFPSVCWTDDQVVLEDLAALHGDLHFLYVDSARTRNSGPQDLNMHGSYQPLGSSNQAQAFAQLYLALQLASRCEFFVGNTESAISQTLIYLACSHQPTCPLIYDFSGSPWLYSK